MSLLGGISVDELYWAWEPNRRMGFSVAATNIGWIDALAEDYLVEPISAERCNLRWTFAVSYRGPSSKAEPLVSRVLPTVQRQLLKKLAKPTDVRSGIQRIVTTNDQSIERRRRSELGAIV